MSIDQVKHTLRQGIEAADHTKTLVQSIQDSARGTQQLAQATVHDSQHEAVERGLRLVGEALHETELVSRRLRGSIDAAEKYLRTLG